MKLDMNMVRAIAYKAVQEYDADKGVMVLGLADNKEDAGSLIVTASELTGKVNCLYLHNINSKAINAAAKSPKSFGECIPELTPDEELFLVSGITPNEVLTRLGKEIKHRKVAEQIILH